MDLSHASADRRRRRERVDARTATQCRRAGRYGAASQPVRGFASDAADGRRAAIHDDTLRSRGRARCDDGPRVVGDADSRARATFACAASNTGPATTPRRRGSSSVRAMAASSRSTQRPARSRQRSGTTASCSSRQPEILQGGDARFYGMTSPPLVYDDLVITGSAVQEFPPRGAAGDVRAWDARSGALVWTFHSVPRPGERFADTWQGDGAERRSGVNVWGFMTVDAERGILYMPFAAPAFDRYGGDRHGDNLFSTLDRRRRRAHRPLPVALPGRSPRHLGQRPAGSAAAVRRPHRWRNRARGGRELEERLAVLPESRQRRTDSRDRGAPRARKRRARRGDRADATLSRS